MSLFLIKPLLDHALTFQETLDAWARYLDHVKHPLAPDFHDVVAAADVLASRLHDLHELEDDDEEQGPPVLYLHPDDLPPDPPRIPRTPVHLPTE